MTIGPTGKCHKLGKSENEEVKMGTGGGMINKKKY